MMHWLEQYPWLITGFALLCALCGAWLVRAIVAALLKPALAALVARTRWRWDDAMLEHGVFHRLTQVLTPLLVQFSLPFIPDLPATAEVLLRNLTAACAVLFAALAANAALDALQAVYTSETKAGSRSVKSYFQVGKLLILSVGAIVIVAALIDKSPLILLSGLGAMSAVLLLVFRDTLLSFVASIQLASNDMLRVGDWIEMPQVGADGGVVDIALHTVKVQNWDNTITTIPTWRLIGESFKNWRGMQQSGGRRIKRSLRIDTHSIEFLDDAAIERLQRLALLRDYLREKRQAIDASNSQLGEAGSATANRRRLTNIGTFRAYVLAYLQQHPDIHQGMTCMVRLLEPAEQGVPVELYCFTNTTQWVAYEGIQGDIFDHLLAILPEFGLRLFQNPAGADLRALRMGEIYERIVN